MKTCRAAGKGGQGEREKGSGADLRSSILDPRRWKRWAGRCVRVWLVCMLAAILPACAYYSFTGATIPARFDTIAIPLVEDNSRSAIPTLDEELTEGLTNRFVRQTRLTLETDESAADVVLTARIERYVNEPTAVSGEERATQNRVTLTVSVRYLDRVEDRPLLDRTFTSFEQYDPVADGPEGEEAAALAALDNIADDVFTAATSNW